MINITPLASGSRGNCYHISDGNSSLLLEAGIKFKEIRQKLNFNTRDIEAALISHEHNDHSASIKDVARAGIDIYTSKGTQEALGIDSHRIKTMKAFETIQIGTWKVLAFDVQHDVSEPLGFLIMNEQGEKLLFATDTHYIKYRFGGLTHIMIECNYSTVIMDEAIKEGSIPPIVKKRVMRSHFSLENVKEFFKANDLSDLQETWLIHLSDGNSDEKQFKQDIQAITGSVVYVA